MENNDISPVDDGQMPAFDKLDMSEGYGTLIRKILSVQKEIMKCDWSPDMAYQVQGNIVRYVSLSKMKANIAPIFQANGLVLGLRFDRPVVLDAAGKLAQHYMVRMEVTLSDAESGCFSKDIVWGEAGDTGDKGITKSESYAFKQWLSTKFMLADGIDIEDEPVVEQPKFVKRSEAETEEMKSKVLSNAVKPSEEHEQKVKEPAQKPSEKPNGIQKAPEEEPQAEKPAESGKTSKKETDGKTESEPEATKDIPNVEGYKLEGPQAKAVNKIIADWEKRAKEGRISAKQYNEMSAAVVSIASPADAVAFIKKYRAV